jgi:hypothetical protein
MSSKLSKILLYCFVISIAQILFANYINLWGVFNPKIYPIFLLLLPKNLKHVLLMIIGLFYGFFIDMFSLTFGIGMASSVFICFVKPYLFRLVSNKRADDEVEIRTSLQGLPFMLKYLSFGLILFHFFYFFVELGEFRNVFYIALKSVLSSFLSLVLYILYTLMYTTNSFSKKK